MAQKAKVEVTYTLKFTHTIEVEGDFKDEFDGAIDDKAREIITSMDQREMTFYGEEVDVDGVEFIGTQKTE